MPTGVYQRGAPKMFEFTCGSCGKACKKLESQTRKSTPKFCSSICFGKSIKGMPGVERVCGTCGISFRGRERTKFCCPECAWQSRRKADAKWRDPEQIKKYMAEYGKRNKERIRKIQLENVRKNPESKRTAARRYAHKHRVELAAAAAERRRVAAEKRAISGPQMRELFAKAESMCVYCGLKVERLTLDHITPIAEGGKNNRKNLIPCCARCNSSKGKKPIEKWLYEKHGLDGLVRAYIFMASNSIDRNFYQDEAK